MRNLLLLTALIALSACGVTPKGDLIRQTVAEVSDKLADDQLEVGEYLLCNRATIGAIKRRYGQSTSKLTAYFVFCRDEPLSPRIPL